MVGTPLYLSPEICQCKPYAQTSDMWAVGCVLYEMMTLRYPFAAPSISAVIALIVAGRFVHLHTWR